MSRFTKRATIGCAVVGLAALLSGLTGAPAASGQSADEAAAPAPYTSPAFAGTGNVESSGLAPEATIRDGGNVGEGQPLAAESVIGADGRVQVTDTTRYPARAIGQIELDFDGNQGNGYLTCTGWLIDANTILTSGHCAFDPAAGPNVRINNAQFYPGRNGASDPYGGCNVDVNNIFSRAGWRIDGKPKHDWAVMQLDCTIGNTVGHLGYFALPGVNQLDGRTARVEGYPGDKPYGTHWKMSGTINSRTDASNIYYPMDTFGGQSGSPIMVANRPSCGGPCGMGIHSYGASGNPLMNSGPRITVQNFGLISDFADNNNP